jgi:hydroxymethylglutaryl-CoA lyase
MSAKRRPSRTPMSGLPERVRIWEVGPRDGLQNESAVVPTDVKIAFIERLADAGIPVVESASFVRPDRIPQLADATEVMTRLRRRDGTRYPVLVPNLRGLEAAIACDARDIAVFASATETFAQRNLGRSLSDQMAMFGPVIRQALDADIPVRGYVSMCFGDPWEGHVDPQQVVDVCLELHETGCHDISLGDTIGVATPGQVSNLIVMLDASGISLDRIGVHFHDTYGQALSNTLAALQSGISTVDASAGGIGGCPYADSATGNLATEDVVWMLDGLGVETGIDLGSLVDASTWFTQHLGRPASSRAGAALREG